MARRAPLSFPDPRAVEILLDAYWTSSGWRDERRVSRADFAWAKAKGVMFDDAEVTHAQQMKRLERVLDEVDLGLAGNAFLSSLTTRRLDLRGALASWAVVRHLRPHKPKGKTCEICGIPARSVFDASVLNFERFKWGGVRFDSVEYALFDLTQLLAFAVPLPTADDFALFKRLVSLANAQPKKARAAQLQKAIGPVIKGNAGERSSLLQVMAIGGLLCPEKHTSYLDHFELPSEGSNELGFPLCEWRGADGVNQRQLDALLAAV